MFEDRNLKRDLTALGLAAFTVFLGYRAGYLSQR